MAANNISTLESKRDRQIAKLELSSANRARLQRLGSGTPRPFFYDLARLPTVYSQSSNVTSERVDNPNPRGLLLGRPWLPMGSVDGKYEWTLYLDFRNEYYTTNEIDWTEYLFYPYGEYPTDDLEWSLLLDLRNQVYLTGV